MEGVWPRWSPSTVQTVHAVRNLMITWVHLSQRVDEEEEGEQMAQLEDAAAIPPRD